MDAEQPAFGKGEGLQQQLINMPRGVRQTDAHILPIITHQHRHTMRRWRMMKPDPNFGVTPAPCPVRHEITGDLGMKLKDEFACGPLRGKRPGGNGPLNPQNPFGQQRGQLV